jgi:hypothetical protein
LTRIKIDVGPTLQVFDRAALLLLVGGAIAGMAAAGMSSRWRQGLDPDDVEAALADVARVDAVYDAGASVLMRVDADRTGARIQLDSPSRSPVSAPRRWREPV